MIINKINNNGFTFNSKFITPQKQHFYTEHLTKNMQDKHIYVQNIYKTGINFINKKIDKKEYLNQMFNNLNNFSKKSVKLNDAEAFFIDDLVMFFDLYGLNQNKIKNKTIVKCLGFLT